MFELPDRNQVVKITRNMKISERLRYISEKEAYGVFSWLGNKMSIKSSDIRLTFIYISFITFGSPVLIYVFMAFILKHKEYFKPKHKKRSVWEVE